MAAQSVCTHTSAVVSETCRRTGPSKSVTEPPYEQDVDLTMIFDYPTLAGLAEFIDTALAEQLQAA